MDYLSQWKIPNQLHEQLKDYYGKIVTRFPPEPSLSALHIGHAKAAFINYVIAKKYHGKMIMRFDDTNPLKESTENEIGILEDLDKISIKYDQLTHTSDYFQQIYDFATYLIKNNLAYVDDLDQEIMSQNRDKGIDSPNRNLSVEQNLVLWNNMHEGMCLRLKINMKHKNGACRDPTIMRYLNANHHNTGNRFRIYPTYDFACPIVDSIEGVTHVFRSVEFTDRDEQYDIILNYLGLRKPLLFSYGKVNFEGAVMSKRKIKELIEKGIVTGIDDPKLLTIKGLFKRGLHLEALYEFIAKIGFSKSSTNMTEQMLWATNKKHIDNLATRFTVIPSDTAKQYTITDSIINTSKEVSKFVKNPNLGTRQVYYSNQILVDCTEQFNPHEEITLMNWGNVFIDYDKITLHLEGSPKTTEKKVLWLDDITKIKVIITTYHGLYNPSTVKEYYGEQDMMKMNPGDYIQLFKMNYYICNRIDEVNKVVYLSEI